MQDQIFSHAPGLPNPPPGARPAFGQRAPKRPALPTSRGRLAPATRLSPAAPPRLPPGLPLQLSLGAWRGWGRGTRQPLLPGPAAAGVPPSALRRVLVRVRGFRGWCVPGAQPPDGPCSRGCLGSPTLHPDSSSQRPWGWGGGGPKPPS